MTNYPFENCEVCGELKSKNILLDNIDGAWVCKSYGEQDSECKRTFLENKTINNKDDIQQDKAI